MAAPIRKIRLGPTDTLVEKRGDGALLMRSPHPLGAYPVRLTERLEQWARVPPTRAFIAQRDARGDWRGINFADTLATVRRLSQALLGRRLPPERALGVLVHHDIRQAALVAA